MTYGYGEEPDEWRAPTRPQGQGGWPPGPGASAPRHGSPDERYDPEAERQYEAYPPAAARPPQPARSGQVYGQRARVEPAAYESVWDDPPYPPAGGPAPHAPAAGYPATAGYPAPPTGAPQGGAYQGGGYQDDAYPDADPQGGHPDNGYPRPATYGRPAGYPQDGAGYPTAPARPHHGGQPPDQGYPTEPGYPARHGQGGGHPQAGYPSAGAPPTVYRPVSPSAYPPAPPPAYPPAPGAYRPTTGYPPAPPPGAYPQDAGYPAAPPHPGAGYRTDTGYPGSAYELEGPPIYTPMPERGYPGETGRALERSYPRDPGYPDGNLPVPYVPAGYPSQQFALDSRPAEAADPDGGYRPHGRRGRTTWADEQPALEAGPAGLTGAGPVRGAHRGRTIAVAIALVMVLLGATSVAVFWLNQRRASGTSVVQPHPTTDDRSIADQKVDPRPLTTAEVFGKAKIVSTAKGGGLYQVVGSDIAKSCAGAVTDQISVLMTTLGCTQVVRGTMFSPDHAYVITAGIFNLPDSAAAAKAFSSIKTDIGNAKGRFMGLAAGGGTDIVTQAQAHLAWDARGHYLTYCVIVLASGQPIAANDARTPLIVSDVLERYLGDTVLSARDKHVVTTASPSSAPPS